MCGPSEKRRGCVVVVLCRCSEVSLPCGTGRRIQPKLFGINCYCDVRPKRIPTGILCFNDFQKVGNNSVQQHSRSDAENRKLIAEQFIVSEFSWLVPKFTHTMLSGITRPFEYARSPEGFLNASAAEKMRMNGRWSRSPCLRQAFPCDHSRS